MNGLSVGTRIMTAFLMMAAIALAVGAVGWRGLSRTSNSMDDIVARRLPAIPALMRGYLRLGAQVCGEPAYDPDFGVGDFPALLDKRRADTRYLTRLRSVSSAADAVGS